MMTDQQLELSRKQRTAYNLLSNPQIVEIYFGGAAGSGKTMLVCLWALAQMAAFPGIRIGLGRKELTRLKQTTVVTLFREAHPLMDIKPESFKYFDQRGLITYRNGSSIQLLDLTRQPSDPDFNTLGSLNFTHVIIEEAGEIVKTAKDVFGARKNRFLNTEYGIVGKTVLTGNPSQNFTYNEYYEPYKQRGMGDYQQWEVGEVEVKDKLKPAYRAFVRSLPIDNPYLPHNYIEVLKSLPPTERKRLYEGNWDYQDDDNMLFKPVLFDRAVISELTTGNKAIGLDVADVGSDRSIVSRIEDGILVDQREFHIDGMGEKAVSEQTALELIKYAQQNGFESKDAQDIAVDTIGIGVGVRDFLRSKGWYIREFIAGSRASVEGYKNLRSQSLWEMAQAMDKGKFHIWSQLTTLGELRKQLMAHEYAVEERVIKILPKDKVKEKLGYSPDHSDSANIAYWASLKSTDAKHDASRIRF